MNFHREWQETAFGGFEYGIVKYYFKTVTGDLGDPADPVGDPGDPATGFGGENQVALTQQLPSTNKQPDWWIYPSDNDEKTGYRWVEVHWSLKPKCGPQYQTIEVLPWPPRIH